jgi:NodT family efflux transporter outer membrane factor (OMF) lipoprotein
VLSKRRCFYISLMIACFAIELSGCMLGPDFHAPSPPKAKSYTPTPLPLKTQVSKQSGEAGRVQRFIMNKEIPAQWWYLFHSPQINQLVQTGLINSPTMAAAQAALQQANENLNAQIGSTLWPQVTAGLTGARQKLSGTSFGESSGNTQSNLFNLFNASVSVSYNLDLFGQLRRQVEGSRATVDYQQYELQAAHLTLTSNIVTTTFSITGLTEQIRATEAIIQEQTKTLHIVEKQFELGGVSRSDLLSQQALLAQTKATLPPLQQSVMQNKHALAVLIGKLPSEAQFDLPHFNKITLPHDLPIGLPSQLVQQRPDIKAAEALLHVASANIGVATANLFPSVTLTGGYGWQNTVLSSLINPSNTIWNGMTSVSQSIWNGGSLMAQKRAAIFAYDQAYAQYRQTVLQAFQNVADVLRALQHDAESLAYLQQQETSAKESWLLTKTQYEMGGNSYLNLLVAEKTYHQAMIARISAQTIRYQDTAALFQALGGGWWYSVNTDRGHYEK